jgi:hypothetical protein
VPLNRRGADHRGQIDLFYNVAAVLAGDDYDLDTAASSKLANISTRGLVGTDQNVLICGFIPGASDRTPLKVLIRALGPSLTNQGLSGALQDPLLELHDVNGQPLISDNWRDAPDADDIQATLPPPHDRESAQCRR